VKQSRPSPPPPLEANDRRVTVVGTAGWAVALIVLVIVRDRLPADARWWIWTCAAAVAMGLFALWYVPRLKRARARSAARRPQDQQDQQEQLKQLTQHDQADQLDQSSPRDSGSNTVSSTETPGTSTMS
jgi:ABC-type nickel/cobalt efflux system permease component RcnA